MDTVVFCVAGIACVRSDERVLTLTLWCFVLQVSLVYGQMNEPPGARARVCLTGLTVAEFFRDHEGQDVLLFIDNIFRFTQAGSEVSFLRCMMYKVDLMMCYLSYLGAAWLILIPCHECVRRNIKHGASSVSELMCSHATLSHDITTI